MTKPERKSYSTIEQQVEANKRYYNKHKEIAAYKAAKRSTKSFILSKATREDLTEINHLIEQRKTILDIIELSYE